MARPDAHRRRPVRPPSKLARRRSAAAVREVGAEARPGSSLRPAGARRAARAAGRAGPSVGEVNASATMSAGSPSAPRRRRGGSSTATLRPAAPAGGGACRGDGGSGCCGSICSVTRSGVTSLHLQLAASRPASTSGGTCAVSGMPASTSTACCSPREATRAISVAPSRSGTSGSWARSSAAATAIGSMPFKDAAARADDRTQHGPRALHRRLRHARRAGAPGPDRQRPRQRVDARLQGRPHDAAVVRLAAARQLA